MDGLYANPHWKGDDQPFTLRRPDDDGASYRVPAKSLKIIWGNDTRYWQWIKFSPEEDKSTGFGDGAMLLQVNWLEVTGKFSFTNTLSTGDYEIYYVVKFQSDAFGWRSAPVKFRLRFNGKEEVNKVLLESYRKKNNVWQEIYGGRFTVSSDQSAAGVVEFGMYEVESNWWKGSMVLAGIKIKPKAAVTY